MFAISRDPDAMAAGLISGAPEALAESGQVLDSSTLCVCGVKYIIPLRKDRQRVTEFLK